MKYLITDYKKEVFYGDCHATEDGWYSEFAGKRIMIKILWLFWITYKSYEV